MGHQDDDPSKQLDRRAKLNCEMDQKAKEYLQQLQTERTQPQQDIPQPIEGEPWPFTINRVKVCCKLKKVIKEQVHGNKAKAYWEQKTRFAGGTAEDVDWQATEDTVKTMRLNRQHWLSKHNSGFCATGKMMVRRKERETAKCPRCEHAVEDSQHVLQCRGAGTDELWDRHIEDVKIWMNIQETDPKVQQALLAGIKSWRNGEHPTEEAQTSGTDNASVRQEKIGWQNIMEGFPAKGWADEQQQWLV